MQQDIATDVDKEYLNQLIKRQGELNKLIHSLLVDNELFEKEFHYLKKNFSERNLDLNSFEIKLCAYFRLGLIPINKKIVREKKHLWYNTSATAGSH